MKNMESWVYTLCPTSDFCEHATLEDVELSWKFKLQDYANLKLKSKPQFNFAAAEIVSISFEEVKIRVTYSKEELLEIEIIQ